MKDRNAAKTRPARASEAGTRHGAAIARTIAAGLACAFLLLAVSGPALAEKRMSRYDSSKSGHPVRIAAYIVHPIGVVLDNLIFKPAYWLGTHEPLKTLFGVTD